jgi:hypothetical protein
MTMKFSKNLMTGLIGLALVAAPMTAAAQDRDSGRNNSRQVQTESRSNHSQGKTAEHKAAPAVRVESRDQHSARVETRNAAPAVATRNESRDNGRVYNGAPAVTTNREVRGDRDNGDRDYNHGDRDYNHGDRDYKNYGDRDFDHDRDYAAGGWVMPYGYSGGACAWAQHLRNVYRHDEATGHPAAAADLLYQLHRAERNCGGVPYGYNEYR